MSDNLISRKAVIQAVDKHTTEDGRLDDDISVILEEIPTAYDVDAVCEEMNNLIYLSEKCPYIQKDCFKKNCEDCMVEKCINIVINGGRKE